MRGLLLSVMALYVTVVVLPLDRVFFALIISPRTLLFWFLACCATAYYFLEPFSSRGVRLVLPGEPLPATATPASNVFLMQTILRRLWPHKKLAVVQWMQSKLDASELLPAAFRSPKLMVLELFSFPEFSNVQRVGNKKPEWLVDFFFDSKDSRMLLVGLGSKVQVEVRDVRIAGRLKFRLRGNGQLMMSLVAPPMLTVHFQPRVMNSDINLEGLRQSLTLALEQSVVDNFIDAEQDLGTFPELASVHSDEHLAAITPMKKNVPELELEDFQMMSEPTGFTPRGVSKEFLPVGRIFFQNEKCFAMVDVDGLVHIFIEEILNWVHVPIGRLLGAPPIEHSSGATPHACVLIHSDIKCVVFVAMSQLFLMKKLKAADFWKFEAVGGIPAASTPVTVYYSAKTLNLIYVTAANQLLHLHLADFSTRRAAEWDLNVIGEDLLAGSLPSPVLNDKKGTFAGVLWMNSHMQGFFSSQSSSSSREWRQLQLPELVECNSIPCGHVRSNKLVFAFVGVDGHIMVGAGSSISDIHASFEGQEIMAPAVSPLTSFNSGSEHYIIFRNNLGQIVCFFGDPAKANWKSSVLLKGDVLVAVGPPTAIPTGLQGFRCLFPGSDQNIWKLSGFISDKKTSYKLQNMTLDSKLSTL